MRAEQNKFTYFLCQVHYIFAVNGKDTNLFGKQEKDDIKRGTGSGPVPIRILFDRNKPYMQGVRLLRDGILGEYTRPTTAVA